MNISKRYLSNNHNKKPIKGNKPSSQSSVRNIQSQVTIIKQQHVLKHKKPTRGKRASSPIYRSKTLQQPVASNNSKAATRTTNRELRRLRIRAQTLALVQYWNQHAEPPKGMGENRARRLNSWLCPWQTNLENQEVWPSHGRNHSNANCQNINEAKTTQFSKEEPQCKPSSDWQLYKLDKRGGRASCCHWTNLVQRYWPQRCLASLWRLSSTSWSPTFARRSSHHWTSWGRKLKKKPNLWSGRAILCYFGPLFSLTFDSSIMWTE